MSHKSRTLCPMERESGKTIFEKIFEISENKLAKQWLEFLTMGHFSIFEAHPIRGVDLIVVLSKQY